VFTWERIPRDQNGEVANTFSIAPSWAIEILSPVREALTKSSQSQTKVTKNILHCLNHGTQTSWLIDPDEQTVFVYLPKRQPEVFDQSEQTIPVPSFANDLNLSVGLVFG
jgi:Uma2 family endonuclease